MSDFTSRFGQLSMSLTPSEVESSLGAPDEKQDVVIPVDSNIGVDFFHKIAGGEKVKEWSYFRGNTQYLLVFALVDGEWKLAQTISPLPYWPDEV